ncbi:MAG: methyltransferase domain-containing protein [Planctomycetota bacterium]
MVDSSTLPAQILVSKPNDSAPASEWLERFDDVYRSADGNSADIPWAHPKPNRSLIQWLNTEARHHVRCGARVCVVGCGLGYDALALAQRGFDVTAFDASPNAIESARTMHDGHDIRFQVADLFDLPSSLSGRFDLAVEVHTLQSLPPAHRTTLASSIASLLHRHGLVLAVARGREESIALDDVEGPPFAFTAGELESTMGVAGMRLATPVDKRSDDNAHGVLRLTALFERV